MSNNGISDAALAYLSFLVQLERDRQKVIVKARKYYAGEHFVYLTDRLREFLNVTDDTLFNLNVCRTIVSAVSERLLVRGFDVAEAEVTDEQGNITKPQTAWLADLWKAARMDELQTIVHDDALSESESFVIVDWDDKNGRARFTPQRRFTDVEQGGDGEGCKLHYTNDDPAQTALFASKRWTEQLGQGKTRRRMTLYYPERIEKYELVGNAPTPFQDEGDATWPLPWVATDGTPIGIPVVHFRNKELRAEQWDAMPTQDRLNKALVDLVAASDMEGFGFLKAFGWVPTTDGKALAADGSNKLRLEPGAIVGSMNKDGTLERVLAGNLSQLLDNKNDALLDAARVSDTPVSRLQTSGQVAAAQTLKEQIEPLLAKIRIRQTIFGNAWEQCMRLARKLSNLFGKTTWDETADIETSWQPAYEPSETEKITAIGMKVLQLRIPLQTAWREAGYTPAQIAEMMDSPEFQARLSLIQTGMQAATQAKNG